MSRCVSFRRLRDSALRFPPLASAGDSSPASQVLSECSDFPPSVPPRSLSFAKRYHALLLVARQRGVAVSGSSSVQRRCLNPLPSTCSRGDDGISQVPRQPLCEHALLFDPGGPRASGHYDAPDVAFRSVDGVGSAFSHLSRLNHTACSLGVYASRLGLLRSNTTQDSLPTGGQPCWDRTLTRWVAKGGFRSVLQLTSFPPPRSFPGAPAAVTP
jgi:hypothetical protein